MTGIVCDLRLCNMSPLCVEWLECGGRFQHFMISPCAPVWNGYEILSHDPIRPVVEGPESQTAWSCLAGCLQLQELLEIREIFWNLIDVPVKICIISSVIFVRKVHFITWWIGNSLDKQDHYDRRGLQPCLVTVILLEHNVNMSWISTGNLLGWICRHHGLVQYQVWHTDLWPALTQLLLLTQVPATRGELSCSALPGSAAVLFNGIKES